MSIGGDIDISKRRRGVNFCRHVDQVDRTQAQLSWCVTLEIATLLNLFINATVILPQEDKLNALIKAAGVTIEPFWPGLFAKVSTISKLPMPCLPGNVDVHVRHPLYSAQESLMNLCMFRTGVGKLRPGVHMWPSAVSCGPP